MLYRIRVKTVGFSTHESEYFLKFEGRAVRTVPARHAATEFHLQEAVDTLEKLKQRGISAEICESIFGETRGQPFERTPVERTIPPEWEWLISSPQTGQTADGRVFLKANGQTIYASTFTDLVGKIIALADFSDSWRGWLAQSKPANAPPASSAPKKWYGVQRDGGQPAWFPTAAQAESEAAKLRAGLRPADKNRITIVETV